MDYKRGLVQDQRLNLALRSLPEHASGNFYPDQDDQARQSARRGALAAKASERGARDADATAQKKKARKQLKAAEKKLEEEKKARLTKRQLQAEEDVNVPDEKGTMAVTTLQDSSEAWLETLALTSCESMADKLDDDEIKEDHNRERSFQDTALESVTAGHNALKALGVPYRRPDNFYCEMLKSDVHMNRIQERLERIKSNIQALENREDRVYQRKLGKQLQAEKLKAKAGRKKEELKKIEDFKQKQKEAKKRGTTVGNKRKREDSGILDTAADEALEWKSKPKKPMRKVGSAASDKAAMKAKKFGGRKKKGPQTTKPLSGKKKSKGSKSAKKNSRRKK
eukprot:TRINITY_DN67394_c7_g1_i1.p2 TRINITY_DN67394_c7_g1~~TRINITY_DN67394_c7_g1_i1.p2  ORF type:complete len:339 (-),score=63.11 TRINITY_DN67394_c7_g1_i1:1747-2763(-)